MILIMSGYHKEPIATGSTIKQCNFQWTKRLREIAFKNLGDNWAGGQRYGLS